MLSPPATAALDPPPSSRSCVPEALALLCGLCVQASAGWSPLHHACSAGLPDRARALLLQGADESALRGPAGREATPLQLARAGREAAEAAAQGEDAVAAVERWRRVERLMERALLPWYPTRQALFPPLLRGLARVLMLVDHRLSRAVAAEEAARGESAPKRLRPDTRTASDSCSSAAFASAAACVSSTWSSLSTPSSSSSASCVSSAAAVSGNAPRELPALPRDLWRLIAGFAVRRCEVEQARALGFAPE